MVIPAGFEPATISLEGWCSIQLSYGTVVQQFACSVCRKCARLASIRSLTAISFHSTPARARAELASQSLGFGILPGQFDGFT